MPLASCTIGRIQAQEKKNNKERKVGNGKKNGTGEKVERWTPRFSLFHSSSLSPLERGRRLSGGERCRPKRIRSAISPSSPESTLDMTDHFGASPTRAECILHTTDVSHKAAKM